MERAQQVFTALARNHYAEQVLDELADRVEEPRAFGADLQQTFRPELVCVRGALLRVVELLQSGFVVLQQIAELANYVRSAGGVAQVSGHRTKGVVPAEEAEQVVYGFVTRGTHGASRVDSYLDEALTRGRVVGVLARTPELLDQLFNRDLHTLATQAQDLGLYSVLVTPVLARATLLRTHGRLLGHDVFEQRALFRRQCVEGSASLNLDSSVGHEVETAVLLARVAVTLAVADVVKLVVA